MSSFAEWKWDSPQDNADISQHIVPGPYVNRLKDHSEGIDAKKIWNHVVKNAVFNGTHWVNSRKLSIQHIIQKHKQYSNTILSHFHNVPLFYPLPLFCLCIINHPSICHEIPHLLDTQKGRLCLFFIWTVGDGARCLAAAECSGVTVPLTGHDEQPQMKDEAWRILERGAPLDLLLQEYTRWMRAGKTFFLKHFCWNQLLTQLKPCWKCSW